MKPLVKLHLNHAVRAVCLASALVVSSAATNAGTLDYLQGLLSSTPEGGWVQANTTSFSSVWASTDTSYGNAGAVVNAWSSFAWDSTGNQLLLWGGGHANYAGNEMYIWNGSTGAWALGSLPSAMTTPTASGASFVVDNAAPQSSHTYDNSVYLPINNMYLTFGGAAYNAGDVFQTNVNGVVQRAGPWLYDPTKASSTLVGGTTGSGVNTAAAGGNMWINRGTEIGFSENHVNGATAYRTENGKDVVYVSMMSQGSGLPNLYRYTLGDVRNGGTDTWQLIGTTVNSYTQQATATIDTAHNLFVRTAKPLSGTSLNSDLAVWNLSASGSGLISDVGVQLYLTDGTRFSFQDGAGMDYDAATDTYYIYDGASPGVVYTTRAAFNANGTVATTWTVQKHVAATSSTPLGNVLPSGSTGTGVNGKWQYVSALNAYINVDGMNSTNTDAGVWLYKPFSTSAAAPVPENSTLALMLAGLGGLAWMSRRRSTAQTL